MEEELIILLKEQLRKYPAMHLQDCVKLLYQRFLGSEHMVMSEESCYEMLVSEKEKIGTDVSFPAYEELGENSCRFNLLPLSGDSGTLHTLTNLFIKSTKTLSENIPHQRKIFEASLTMLLNLVNEGQLPFDYDESRKFLQQYIEAGYPAVHHSQIYRDTYHPAYRLMRTGFARYFSLFATIDKLLKSKPHVVIAIDGKCGGGKSTLASILTEVYSANLIHMDDFYLPAELRTPDRLGEIGGNIHYECFTSQVIPALSELKNCNNDTAGSFKDYMYQLFDCHVMNYKNKLATISDLPLTIVEGSYSLRPEFRNAYDLKIFLDISPETQKKRLLARNGEEAYKNFESKWIPMELKYFEGYQVKNCCDLIY